MTETRYRPPDRCRKHGGPMLRYDHRTVNSMSAHKARGLCRRCYSQEVRRGTLANWPLLMPGWIETRRSVVSYVEYLRDSLGLEPVKWVAELGTTPAALSRRLYRAGRADLARPVERIAQRRRKEVAA